MSDIRVIRFPEGGTVIIRSDPHDAGIQIIRSSRRPNSENGADAYAVRRIHGDDGRLHEVIGALYGTDSGFIIHLAYIVGRATAGVVRTRAASGCAVRQDGIGDMSGRVFAAMTRVLATEPTGPLILSFLDDFEIDFLSAIDWARA